MLRATLLAVLACHVEAQQPGDNYVVEPLPGSGGCRGVAEFLGAGPAAIALPLHPLCNACHTIVFLDRLLQGRRMGPKQLR